MALDFVGFINTEKPEWSAAKKQRLLDSAARALGWTDTIDDGEGNQIPNPVSKQEAVNAGIGRRIAEWVQAWETKSQIESARTSVAADVQAEFGELES